MIPWRRKKKQWSPEEEKQVNIGALKKKNDDAREKNDAPKEKKNNYVPKKKKNIDALCPN